MNQINVLKKRNFYYQLIFYRKKPVKEVSARDRSDFYLKFLLSTWTYRFKIRVKKHLSWFRSRFETLKLRPPSQDFSDKLGKHTVKTRFPLNRFKKGFIGWSGQKTINHRQNALSKWVIHNLGLTELCLMNHEGLIGLESSPTFQFSLICNPCMHPRSYCSYF